MKFPRFQVWFPLLLLLVAAGAAFTILGTPERTDEPVPPELTPMDPSLPAPGEHLLPVGSTENLPPLGPYSYLIHDQAPVSPMGEKSPGAEVGPSGSWPLTHPKMCAGILLADRAGGETALTEAQARGLVPVLHGLGAAWQKVVGTEDAIRAVLTKQQRDHIYDFKELFEDPRFIEEYFPGGTHLQTCYTLLRERAAEPSPQGDESRRDPQPVDDDFIITYSDMLTGVYMLERTPDMAISPEQARQMLELYEAIDIATVKQAERDLADLLVEPQVKYIQDHMPEINVLKKQAFDGEHEKGLYGDPLIWMTIEEVQKKVNY